MQARERFIRIARAFSLFLVMSVAHSSTKFPDLKKAPVLLALLFTFHTTLFSQRDKISINDGWFFAKATPEPGASGSGLAGANASQVPGANASGFAGANAKPVSNPSGGIDTAALDWLSVTLPHSWNTADVMDDARGYYRGVGWYKRNIHVPLFKRDKHLAIYFEGAGQLATVYVNGRKAVTHTGGYNGFYVSLDNLVKGDSLAEILVSVDNSFNEDIAPLTADFTFFGGLYRNVSLISTDAIHFEMGADGGSSVLVTTPHVSAAEATVMVRSSIVTPEVSGKTKKRNLLLVSEIRDASGKLVDTDTKKLQLAGGIKLETKQEFLPVATPRLWSVEDPYLYTISTRIVDPATKAVLDEISNPLAFRWYRFSADSGFFLNDKPVKLVGASRHQDRPGMGNAVPSALAREDIGLLKKMGGNFLRVAHYPQDQSVLDECDRLGIIASVEIPLVNEITESENFYKNSEQMLREMIAQNHNHPSVVMWTLMNEIMLKPHFTNDKERQKIYYANIVKLATRLDSITRSIDPARYTMIANHGDFDRYNNTGLTKVAMIVGWNLYSGWYGGELKDFASFLDKHHQRLPDKPLIVSEYGADADPRIRSFTPVKFDKSIEYSLAFHQYYLNEMLKRPFCVAAIIWNLADFNSETREETMPHINNKGMLRWDRQPKDLYYYYQAKLLDKAFVKITSGSWAIRTGIADSGRQVSTQQLQVASNAPSVELRQDGRSLGTQQVSDGLAVFEVPFADGPNLLEVIASKDGKEVRDFANISFRLLPYTMKTDSVPFRSVNILLGARRMYIDEAMGEVWIPDQPYRPGSWGFVGGKPFNHSGNGRLPYGSDKNISGTWDDPVYQTQQVGISEYRLDVPDGYYELTLHFAELSGVSGANLVYNLSESTTAGTRAERVFDVSVNGHLLLEDFNMAASTGAAKAISKKMTVQVIDGKGILVGFNAKKGEPVLNALQVRRIY